MDSRRAPTIASNGMGTSLQDLVRGERARALHAQLSSWHPECSTDEIEDAIQTACGRFLAQAEGISAPGQIYTWIRTTAHRLLNRETAHHAQELSVEPAGDQLEGFADERPGPAEELIAEEDDADLAALVKEVYDALPSRASAVFALHTAGYGRQEIAERLRLPERTVKRDVEEIMEKARGALARLAGGGCCRFREAMVMRSACGLATSAEEAGAHEHIAKCGRCAVFSERLIAWREKAGAMLPVPAVEGASPGLIERSLHKSAEGLSSLKQQILDGTAQVKQHAAAGYYRTVDPTPLAAARPGTIATMVAGCIALGGGATYCVDQGVDPLGAATGLIAGRISSGRPISSAASAVRAGGAHHSPPPPITVCAAACDTSGRRPEANQRSTRPIASVLAGPSPEIRTINPGLTASASISPSRRTISAASAPSWISSSKLSAALSCWSGSVRAISQRARDNSTRSSEPNLASDFRAAFLFGLGRRSELFQQLA